MSEYLLKYIVPPNGVLSVGIPDDISGIYAEGNLTVAWDYNGAVADLFSGTIWEPPVRFSPRPTSALILKNGNSAPVSVAIRCAYD